MADGGGFVSGGDEDKGIRFHAGRACRGIMAGRRLNVSFFIARA
jgi:hypothetical protein